ncbi:hypothetical protein ABQE93_12290 [Mycolicibacterium sp. XJ662]
MAGAPVSSQFLSADRTHVLITTQQWNPLTNTGSTRMVVINTATGKQVGGAVTVSGQPSGAPLFAVDGTRVLVSTLATKSFTGANTTRIAVLRIV